MEQSTLQLHTSFSLGPVDERVFGGFLEQMGRAVYGGIFEPSSEHADEFGCRRDVCDDLKHMGLTTVRYPGGNFVSGYHWRDGVGATESRPLLHSLPWSSIEPNTFGTDEFLQLCERMSWTPMLTVNLGTGSPEEASDWVEYCNGTVGTQTADLRVSNGRRDPYSVKLWCLGNEMDAPWQLGNVPAEDYASRARQAAQMMRRVDPEIATIACGSTLPGLESYMDWDRKVLEILGDEADYLSTHRYENNFADNTPEFLASGRDVDKQIEQVDAVCRYVQALRGSVKRAYISFDEWNVWYKNHDMVGGGQFAPRLLEEVYNLEDALVVAGYLNSFIRHADVVKIANLAQIVNVISPLMTRTHDVLVQSIFHPFRMMSERRQGLALRTVVDGPTYATQKHGDVPFIDASAILDKTTLQVFAVNRSVDKAAPLRVAIAGATIQGLSKAELLTGSGPKAANAFDSEPMVSPVRFDEAQMKDGNAILELPPLSFVAATFRLT